MNAFLAAFLHDLAAFWRNPSSAIVGAMTLFFAVLFRQMEFFPSFTCALVIQLAAGGSATVGFLGVMGEERERGAWDTVARTATAPEPLIAGRAAACLALCLALSAACALLSGIPVERIPFTLLAALPTILPATLFSLALGLIAPDQARANAWGSAVLIPCILPTLCTMFLKVRFWPLPSYATTELLGVAASRGLEPLPAALLIGVGITWTAFGFAALISACRALRDRAANDNAPV